MCQATTARPRGSNASPRRSCRRRRRSSWQRSSRRRTCRRRSRSGRGRSGRVRSASAAWACTSRWRRCCTCAPTAARPPWRRNARRSRPRERLPCTASPAADTCSCLRNLCHALTAVMDNATPAGSVLLRQASACDLADRCDKSMTWSDEWPEPKSIRASPRQRVLSAVPTWDSGKHSCTRLRTEADLLHCRDESYEAPRRPQRKRSAAHRASPGSGAPAMRPGTHCAHCDTIKTPLWRKDRSTGLLLCNACGCGFCASSCDAHLRLLPLRLFLARASDFSALESDRRCHHDDCVVVVRSAAID